MGESIGARSEQIAHIISAPPEVWWRIGVLLRLTGSTDVTVTNIDQAAIQGQPELEPALVTATKEEFKQFSRETSSDGRTNLGTKSWSVLAITDRERRRTGEVPCDPYPVRFVDAIGRAVQEPDEEPDALDVGSLAVYLDIIDARLHQGAALRDITPRNGFQDVVGFWRRFTTSKLGIDPFVPIPAQVQPEGEAFTKYVPEQSLEGRLEPAEEADFMRFAEQEYAAALGIDLVTARKIGRRSWNVLIREELHRRKQGSAGVEGYAVRFIDPAKATISGGPLEYVDIVSLADYLDFVDSRLAAGATLTQCTPHNVSESVMNFWRNIVAKRLPERGDRPDDSPAS